MIELEASERAIAANEKIHNQSRARADIAILDAFRSTIESRFAEMDADARSGRSFLLSFSSSSFPYRASFSRYTATHRGARHRRPRISAGFSTRPALSGGREKYRELEIAQKVTEKLRSRIVL